MGLSVVCLHNHTVKIKWCQGRCRTVDCPCHWRSKVIFLMQACNLMLYVGEGGNGEFRGGVYFRAYKASSSYVLIRSYFVEKASFKVECKLKSRNVGYYGWWLTSFQYLWKTLWWLRKGIQEIKELSEERKASIIQTVKVVLPAKGGWKCENERRIWGATDLFSVLQPPVSF